MEPKNKRTGNKKIQIKGKIQGSTMMQGWFRKEKKRRKEENRKERIPPTVGAGFVQEVAEVEQGVSRCQELQESLQQRTNTQGLVLGQARI